MSALVSVGRRPIQANRQREEGPPVAGAGRATMLRREVLSRYGATALAGGLAGSALAACAPAAGGGTGAGGTPPAGTAASGSVTWMHSANPATSGFDRIEAAF